MSTLVIVRKGNFVTIASDSLFTEGSIKCPPQNRVNHHKIHKVENAYVGFTGWAAMHNIFESIIERYPRDLDFRSRKHIFETFRHLHAKLKEDYFINTREKDDQPVESSQWDCFIATPNGIFGVYSYREVNEFDRFWAQGSGMRFALGAMNAVYDLHDTPDKIALAGIQAACEFDDGSCLPAKVFQIELQKAQS
jgi:ATP-dependent protease HslVU (ClpYQ) peptidase subunit